MNLWTMDEREQDTYMKYFGKLYNALDASGWEPLPDNRIGFWNAGDTQVAVIALTDVPLLGAILKVGTSHLNTVQRWELLRKLTGRLERGRKERASQ